MKVSNMTSSKGNKVANQFILSVEGKGTFFQSYSTMIAAKTPEGVKLDVNAWDYSRTTSRYRNQFLGETKKETERKIREGVYQLVDLNGGE